MSYLDIKGQKFNNLTAIQYAGKNKHGRALWLCRCDCGNETIVDVTSLRRKIGATKSCGCYKHEYATQRGHLRKKHGMAGSRIYRIWAGMIQRCRCDKHYSDISVCEEWLKFEPFYEWSKEHGYNDSFEIDRIDNNGNYEPSNCRWATRKDQMRNTSRTHFMTYSGITKCQTEWLNILGIKSKKSFQMLRKKGFSDEQILAYYIQKRGLVNGIN